MRTQRKLARNVKTTPRRNTQSLRKTSFGNQLHIQSQSCRARLKNLLAGHTKPVREDGAQALVPFYQVAKSRLQRITVEQARKPQRHRHRVDRARPLQTIQEPQPTLRKRQRYLRRPRNRQQRWTCRLRFRKSLRQRLNSGSFKQAADRNLNIQR